jgi:hypothetical protein
MLFPGNECAIRMEKAKGLTGDGLFVTEQYDADQQKTRFSYARW